MEEREKKEEEMGEVDQERGDSDDREEAKTGWNKLGGPVDDATLRARIATMGKGTGVPCTLDNTHRTPGRRL